MPDSTIGIWEEKYRLIKINGYNIGPLCLLSDLFYQQWSHNLQNLMLFTRRLGKRDHEFIMKMLQLL